MTSTNYSQLLYLSIIALTTMFISCNSPAPNEIIEGNPAAEGFNISNSDSKAIAIADEVMKAMGGREAWDNTEELSWTFFGNRQHTWNKANQTAKIYSPKSDLTIQMNLLDKTGAVSKGDVEYTKSDSLDHYLNMGERWWINDSYWLVMPFKLKDSGVTLKYIGKDTSQIGRESDVLQLTFEEVGVTPDNKYLVYVDESSRLVTQWDYYASAQDSLPRFQSPWSDYKKHGNILLSGGSIRGKSLSDIAVK